MDTAQETSNWSILVDDFDEDIGEMSSVSWSRVKHSDHWFHITIYFFVTRDQTKQYFSVRTDSGKDYVRNCTLVYEIGHNVVHSAHFLL